MTTDPDDYDDASRVSLRAGEIQRWLDLIPDPAIVVSANGEIRFLSARASALFGYESGAIRGRPVEVLVPEAIRSEHSRMVASFMAAPHARPLGVGGPRLHGCHRSGALIPVEISLSPVDVDREVMVVACIRDVTQARAGELEIVENQKQLIQKERSLAEAQLIARVGSWEWDVDAGTLLWSDEIYRIFGLQPQEFGATYEAFLGAVHPEDRQLVTDRVNQALAQEREYDVEHRIVLPDGTVRFVHERAEVTLGGGGKPTRMIGTVQDVTERRILEEQFRQAQKLEVVGQLAARIAHDFNNILTVVIGSAELLLRSAGQVEGSLAGEILQAGRHATKLTGQLLTLCRKNTARAEVMDLNDAVASFDSLVRRLIGVDVELRVVAEANPGLIRASANHVEQILLNLVVNARDAMPEGGLLTIVTSNVDVAVARATPGGELPVGEYVSLAVRDSGTGVAPELVAKIFEPFVTTKGDGRGTGLGLATVLDLARALGGQVEIDSELGKGASFAVLLPRCDAVDVAAEAEETQSLPERGGGEVILLIEDEEQVVTLTSRILEEAGYTVLAARSPFMALKIAGEPGCSIDMIVSDVVLPRMSGPEVVSRVRQLHTNVKAMFVTGYFGQVEFLHPEMQRVAIMRKPYLAGDLLRAIANTLNPRTGLETR